MIPARFVAEYPKRCLALIKLLEPAARESELMGSFSLLAAAAVFVIPYEPMKSNNPLHKPDELSRALKSLERKPFVTAPFWNEDRPDADAWRFSRIMSNANDTERWVNEDGHHPMEANAKNSLESRKADDVLRVIRNALAHGNIVYLNKDGYERRDTELQFLGFLSLHEDKETYRLVATSED